MDAPEARYLDRDGATLAYQVVGEGAANVLSLGEIAQHFDLAWTDPHIHELYERGATFARTLYLQPRGFGMSDRIRYSPSLEQHADDVLAAMDAEGMHRATLTGTGFTSGIVSLVAARDPDRVANLILFKPLACGPLAPSAELHGWTPEAAAEYAAIVGAIVTHWGTGRGTDILGSMAGTPYNRRLMALMERCSATPSSARAYAESMLSADFSEVLRAVRVPTRVLGLPSPEPEAVGRRVAELVPGATYVALPAILPGASIGEVFFPLIEQIEEAATGVHHSVEADRFLGTLLFTDVVSSTELLAKLGDARYRELRSTHERQVRHAVERAGGRVVKVTGDGTFSVFDGASRAVRCADAVCREAEDLGVQVRAGVHTGELERTGPDVTGLNVHIGARVGSVAAPGEVLVSRTVHDLVAGSGLSFTSRGERVLRGIPGRWELFALDLAGDQVAHLPVEASLATPLDRTALKTARRAPRMTRAAMRVGNAVQRRRARVNDP